MISFLCTHVHELFMIFMVVAMKIALLPPGFPYWPLTMTLLQLKCASDLVLVIIQVAALLAAVMAAAPNLILPS